MLAALQLAEQRKTIRVIIVKKIIALTSYFFSSSLQPHPSVFKFEFIEVHPMGTTHNTDISFASLRLINIR
jgi:hypothetical protein